jgi:hypothetical protein
MRQTCVEAAAGRHLAAVLASEDRPRSYRDTCRSPKRTRHAVQRLPAVQVRSRVDAHAVACGKQARAASLANRPACPCHS